MRPHFRGQRRNSNSGPGNFKVGSNGLSAPPVPTSSPPTSLRMGDGWEGQAVPGSSSGVADGVTERVGGAGGRSRVVTAAGRQLGLPRALPPPPMASSRCTLPNLRSRGTARKEPGPGALKETASRKTLPVGRRPARAEGEHARRPLPAALQTASCPHSPPSLTPGRPRRCSPGVPPDDSRGRGGTRACVGGVFAREALLELLGERRGLGLHVAKTADHVEGVLGEGVVVSVCRGGKG